LPLDALEEVVRAVSITQLSGARGSLLGYVDVRGEVCPVVDARRVFHLPRRAILPSDRMVIIRVGPDRLIVPVDEAGRVCPVRVIETRSPEIVVGDRSREPAGLRAASIDEPDGEIVALVDPVAVFGRFASGHPRATATVVGAAPAG
jgi:chemotaxis signal transduction protein